MEKTQSNICKVLKCLALESHFQVTRLYLEKVVNEHPAPNSFTCLSDILDDLQVSNVTVKVKKEKLKDMSFPCIAHLHAEKEAYYTLLIDCKGGKVHYYDTDKGHTIENLDDFAKKWKGEVMLVSPDEKSGELSYEENRKKEKWQMVENSLIIACLSLLVGVGIFLSGDWVNSLLFVILSMGAVASGLLLWSEFGKPNAVVQQLCSGENMSCNEVLQSSASKLFGFLSWAEVGMFYFVGSLLALLFAYQAVLPLLLFLSILALPYTIFSIYYQARVVKKWCTLCLVVQAVIWGEFLVLGKMVLFLESIQNIDFQTIILFLLSFCLPIAIWFAVKPTLFSAKASQSLHKQLAIFQRDTSLLKNHLLSQQYIEIGNFEQEISLGNPEAPLTLIIVCNPYCKPCGVAHKELHQWIDYFSDEIRMIIRFNADSESDTKKNVVIKHFISLSKSEKLHEALLDWFENPIYETWALKYPVEILVSKT